MSDLVNHPPHYTNADSGIECIEAIESSMSMEEFKGFLKGNVQKYVWRYSQKNGAEDLKKAKWYLERLIAIVELEDAMKNAVEDKGSVSYDPDDYLKPSGCPDGFCPMPSVRQGPSEAMFAPICDH
jgi:CRISPR/Cas system-associated protein Cas5 (RAMP superfamily)